MSYSIDLRPLAALEIFEAYDWYETQKEGLGLEFLNELEHLYSSLRQNPHTYSYYNKPVREGRLDRFPYTIVYEISDASVIIYSVFMSRRDPANKRSK